tara:strand:- start:21 stop:374 length:354 start_codon:yes stop_codon:yes gene_type:complete
MSIKIDFEKEINVSVQVGDIAYFVSLLPEGGYNTAKKDSVGEIGKIIEIQRKNPYYIVCDNSGTTKLRKKDFIMFSKDESVNTSGVKGYYAKVEFANNSKEKVELFAVGSEINESSK